LKKDNLAFLVGGFALGLLVGVGLYSAYQGGLHRQAGQGPVPTGERERGASAAETTLADELLRLKTRLRDDPNDIQSLIRLAHIHHDRQLWEPAVVYYEQALAQLPDSPDLLTDLGICYRGLRRFDDALEKFSRAQALDATHWQSLYNSAVVLAFDLERYDRAKEVLQPLLALDSPPPQLAELLERIERARAGARGER
jgi:cytochrome c-type biogenesis protein CcmH/NrfG